MLFIHFPSFLHAWEQHTHPPSRRLYVDSQMQSSSSSSCAFLYEIVSRRFHPVRKRASSSVRSFFQGSRRPGKRQASRPGGFTLDLRWTLSILLQFFSSCTQLAQESRNIYIVGRAALNVWDRSGLTATPQVILA